jgi:general secretion pathway protein J
VNLRDQAGFTLLELLIAVALLGLLTTILLAGFRLQTQHIGRQSERLERSSLVSTVHSFLRNQLARAQPLVPIGAEERTIMFEGQPGAIAFVATAPESVPNGGLLLFSAGYADHRLMVRWRRFDGGIGEPPRDAGETVLLEGVARLAFHYFGAASPGQAPTWHKSWKEHAYLPSLVQLELTFLDGERMPVLAVAPRLAPVAFWEPEAAQR